MPRNTDIQIKTNSNLLQPMNGNLHCAQSDIKEDKVHFVFNGAGYRGNDDYSFISNLRSLNPIAKKIFGPSARKSYGYLYKAPETPGSLGLSAKMRVRCDEEGLYPTKLSELEVWVNPTRDLANLQPGAKFLMSDATNVLIEKQHLVAHTGPAWGWHLDAYSNACMHSLLVGALSPPSHLDVTFMPPVSRRLKSLEQYVEVYAPNALAVMDDIIPMLKANALHFSMREYPLSGIKPDETEKDGSPCIILELAKGISLAVYAKLHDRIRFEVRFAVPKVVGRSVVKILSPHSLYDQLAGYRQITATYLNRVFSYLNAHMQLDGRSMELMDYVDNIHQAAGNPYDARSLMESLGTRGALRNTPAHMRPAIRKLRQKGILMPGRRGVKGYLLSPHARLPAQAMVKSLQ